ncbi:hypothetical protein [Kribbella sp. NPDC048915]|uniref:hypothetical protein n=1 Tax=Kribbella sp. NPDC048915 TaxID=3155148 RepID=UPI0033DF5513
MSAAEAWTRELESTGRVDFRPRRGRLTVRLIGFGLPMVLSLLTNIDHLRADGITDTLGVLRLTALAAFVYGTAWTAWQLITSRPLIRVDAEGITRGRNLRWSSITRIDDPAGWPLARTVQVHPADRRTRPITIPQDHVEDLDALTPWLRSLHARHSTD